MNLGTSVSPSLPSYLGHEVLQAVGCLCWLADDPGGIPEMDKEFYFYDDKHFYGFSPI